MTAACVTAAEGLRVVLIEKSPFVGGTTAVSGGMVWIPANAKAKQAGMADTTERARLYLKQSVHGRFNENARCAVLRSGDKAIAYLERRRRFACDLSRSTRTIIRICRVQPPERAFLNRFPSTVERLASTFGCSVGPYRSSCCWAE